MSEMQSVDNVMLGPYPAAGSEVSLAAPSCTSVLFAIFNLGTNSAHTILVSSVQNGIATGGIEDLSFFVFGNQTETGCDSKFVIMSSLMRSY
jgi:hypothetical protein